MLTYDTEDKKFKLMDEDQTNQDYFIKGIIAYVPRDITLAKSEYLGAPSHQPGEESDLDISDEESEIDPFQEFQQETKDLFSQCLATQKVMQRPHDEFIKSLIMEIKSLKLTYNVQNAYVTETVFNIVMKTIQTQGLNV